MGLLFTWDSDKAAENVRKHDISFEEAVTVFADPLSVTVEDSLHGAGEVRLLTMGYSNYPRILVVVHTDNGNMMRIITARRATRRERRFYEEN